MTILNTHIFRKKEGANIFIFIAMFVVATFLFGSLEIKTAHGAKYYFDIR